MDKLKLEKSKTKSEKRIKKMKQKTRKVKASDLRKKKYIHPRQKTRKKKIELEKIVEWDFVTFNSTIADIFKIDSIWQLIFFPFFLITILFGYIVTYPFYVLYHLFNNREIYYKERYWRLKE